MKFRANLAKIVANTDQDREHGRDWFAEATEDDMLALWVRIQQLGESRNPLDQLVSRLAQIQFCEFFVEVEWDV